MFKQEINFEIGKRDLIFNNNIKPILINFIKLNFV
jgi:hypothetical protein